MPKYSIIGGLSLEELNKVQRILGNCENLERAQIFGSRAMNTHRPTSDVDLALFGSGLLRSDINKLKIAFEDSTLPHTFDLILHYAIKEPELLAHIKRRGVDVLRKGFYLSEDGEWIPDGWVETSLGEVSPTKQYGYTESASHEEVGPKFLRITDIQNDFVDWESVPYCLISESDLRKYSLEVGDLLIARTGNSTGAVTTIKDQVNAVFASYLIRFKPDEQKVRHEFLDFLTRSRIWTSFVNSVKKGSAQGGANANDFAAFPIKLPPLPEQKAIADVLSSLDKKIELLREQNETLEALAQTLFKRWFIDFNFPDGNGNPYKDSGGAMIASELGEIPEGWSIAELVEFGRIVCGKTPSKKEKAFFGDDIPFIKIPDMHGNMYVQTTGEYLSEEGAKSQANKSIPRGSIVVSCIATVGLVALTSSEAQTNQQINTIVPAEEISREYLFLRMKTLYDFLQNLGAGGSATLNINTTSFSEIKVLQPDDHTLSIFNEVAAPVFQKIEANSHQIQILTRLRYTLLPKMMKGEIRVPIET